LKKEETEELNGIMTLISENGELILKNKKINLIPRAFNYKRYENILVLDLRGNEITEIESSICENLPNIKKLDARNNKIKSLSI
jgi:Leucine-rich repeat (LRR) protein